MVIPCSLEYLNVIRLHLVAGDHDLQASESECCTQTHWQTVTAATAEAAVTRSQLTVARPTHV